MQHPRHLRGLGLPRHGATEGLPGFIALWAWGACHPRPWPDARRHRAGKPLPELSRDQAHPATMVALAMAYLLRG
jgi:hypothetical protein